MLYFPICCALDFLAIMLYFYAVICAIRCVLLDHFLLIPLLLHSASNILDFLSVPVLAVCCGTWQTDRISIIFFLFMGFGLGRCKYKAIIQLILLHQTAAAAVHLEMRWCLINKDENSPPLSIVLKERYCDQYCGSWSWGLYDVSWILYDGWEIMIGNSAVKAAMCWND